MPIQAAWRELEEETGLTPSQLKLWRNGRPFTFDDAAVGRQWTIYPFAFLFEASNGGSNFEDTIKLNWEHESWAWYNPAEVFEEEKFGGVPRLAQSLRQVLFEMDMNQQSSQALQACLQELKTNHQSGSHELTSIALKGFRDILVHLKNDTEWWATVRTAAWHIWKNGRESMGAATLNALLALLHELEGLLDRLISSEDWCDSALVMVDHHLARRRLMPQRIKESFVAYLQTQYGPQEPRDQKLVILTLSASSTIRDAILDAFAATSVPHLDLRILESRPLFEGATMASSILTEFRTKFALSHQSLDLTIHTDASAALASGDVDLVLLGADRIASSGSVSNKTGSLPAVLSAKHISPNAKVLVFSGLEKVAEPNTEDDCQAELEENDTSEVTSAWFSGNVKGLNILDEELQGLQGKTANCSVRVRNIYFEWVPADLIDAYMCDEGVFDRQRIQAEAEKVRMKRERYFENV